MPPVLYNSPVDGDDAQFPGVIDISWRYNLRYDPRLGDEDESGDERDDRERDSRASRTGSGTQRNSHHASRHVRIETPSWNAAASPINATTPLETEKSELPVRRKRRRLRLRKFLKKAGKAAVRYFPMDLQWIPNNWSWSKIKPVIRASILGWVSILFMVINKVEAVQGQASFLLLVAAFLDPPADPFISVLERELIFSLFTTIGWAWSCLGLFLASLARSHVDYNASLTDVFAAKYVEAGPTVILAVFLFIGVAFFLFLKGKLGPGPFLFPSVFGAICIDISIITGVLFPYPYYIIGRAITLPLVSHSALCILFAATVFPSTITAQYVAALSRLFDPLDAALAEHRVILKMNPGTEEFKDAVKKISGLVNKSEAGLGPAAASLRLVKHDIVWGRFDPVAVGGLQWFARRLVTRANGLGVFFTLIEPTRERFPVTPAPSKPTTPAGSRPMTPAASRPGTPLGSRTMTPTALRHDGVTWGASPAPSRPTTPPGEKGGDRGRLRHRNNGNGPAGQHRANASMSSLRHAISRHLHFRLRPHEEDSQDQRLHFSLLHLAHSLSVPSYVGSPENAVGVFESQRYLALEATRLSHPDDPDVTEQFLLLLGDSCDELLVACRDVLRGVKVWVVNVRQRSFVRKKTVEQDRAEHLAKLADLKDKITDALDRFRKDNRHRVLDPYRSAFDPNHVGKTTENIEPPPHRYLFHCYVYQYHLMQFGLILNETLGEIMRLEENSKKSRLWTPRLPLAKWFVWGRYDYNTQADEDRDDDEDPELIPGMEDSQMEHDLGVAIRRDPDALPPHNFFEQVMSWAHNVVASFGGGNVLFAVKAGMLSVILCIPSFLKTSAAFAYSERFVWGIFMGQLTLARFRGDTTFALVARVISTFLGGVVGMVLWYIFAGKGIGNAYGFAATIGVCFPFLYYGRLYWPGPPMTNIIFFVTVSLVLGFSWQNAHYGTIFHFYGFSVAWRRFVLVSAGVLAAFLFSFLPPSKTLRRYQRTMLSTTVAELGTVYCSIVSFANTRGRHDEVDKGQIIQALVAIRMKLKRSVVLRTNIIYEFSLRGKWPAERYHRILELQMQIAYLLSHLMSVVEHLDSAWSRAFLRRTRFLDADFQGDVLSVISMISTSLKTGNPLPQITPCPLLDRFMVHTHGLNVIRQEADDDYGLPRTMTIDTLENEQYLSFAVGVTTAFGIILRLDKLMVATKELVGEQYHIHGIGLPNPRAYERPAKDV